MVGVPGRSKACNTCRQRRVRCDETKPICQRCTKAGFKCLGYKRERVWRNASTVPFPDVPTQTREGAMAVLRFVTAANRKALPTPPREISLIAFKDDICLTFTFAKHVWQSYGVLWLEQAASGKLGQLPLSSTLALSQANFGRSNYQEDIEKQGSVLYGRCLKTLAEQIAANQHGAQHLIIPILVLLMYAGSNSDRYGALVHLKGLTKLLHVHGPEAFQEQPLLSAFEAARSTLMVGGLICKQRLFLDEEKWRSVPWARYPASKTPQSELLDIIIVLPGILHYHADLISSPCNPPMLHHKLIERVKEQLTILYRWRWRWQACTVKDVNADIGHVTAPNGVSRQLDRPYFRSFAAATESMLYNTTLMWLLALLYKMDPLGAAQHIQACVTAVIPGENDAVRFASLQPLHRRDIAVTVHDPAMEVFRAFEWVARHHTYNQQKPTFLYLFPIRMAISVLQEEPENKALVRSVLGTDLPTTNYSKSDKQFGFDFYLSREALLDPEEVLLKKQLFSPQDIRNLIKA